MKNTEKIIFEGYPKEMMVSEDKENWDKAVVLCETIDTLFKYCTVNKNGRFQLYNFAKELPKLKRVPLEPSIEMLDWKLKNNVGVIYEIIKIGKDEIVFVNNYSYLFRYRELMENYKYQPKDSQEWFPCYKEVEVE